MEMEKSMSRSTGLRRLGPSYMIPISLEWVSASERCTATPPTIPTCLTAGFVPTEGLRWSESQHSVSPTARARGGDRDGTVTGASGGLAGVLPNPNTSLHPNPAWSRQRELLMHLLPWYTAAAAVAQAQPGNRAPPCPPSASLRTGQGCWASFSSRGATEGSQFQYLSRRTEQEPMDRWIDLLQRN